MNTHFFFALVLPDDIKTYLNDATEQIKSEFPFKKWLHQADYHITMAFLGNAPDSMKKDALGRMESELANETMFDLELGDIGVFGKNESPRILWAGVKQQDRLFTIQRKIYESCVQAGFELDKKQFKPHITLARKFEGESLFSIERVRQIANLETKHFEAAQIALYQTHLGASPSYEQIFTINLQ
ncbi:MULTISPECIES: RNA 2',3'-cyclic phosphodiesterase [unclassified Peribacillus]|uniref:RNA 2',3'-cyclic phosphodiesterase n=1 Tax=unclassified Peribacillus TaxID=2675266 RepID=UPI001912DC7F|nr:MULTISPECIES: RNA 2',3'-cyclic phosphodiesterase [unclassified Peribacillus]MBK5500416.1 RNA 2',3'-cyclic phosphodiesterase [Peribacillus sp. TH14]WMX54552.1 RNA 2',3'-cyclic phosphodiesterase [Peribacillus sp. R9-11]